MPSDRDRLTAELTEEPPPLAGVLARALDLVAALRRAGLPAAQAGAIDAVRALRHVELLEREQLREALAAVTVTARTQRGAFDELFDLYFPARPVAPSQKPSEEPEPDEGERGDADADLDPDDALRALLEVLDQGDQEAIRRAARAAVERFGRVEGRDGRVTYFQYKVFRAIDLQQLLTELLGREQDERDGELSPLEERLLRDEFERRLRTFREEVDTEIRRHAAADRGLERVAERLVRPPIEERDLFHLNRDEQQELRAQIRPLARKLATRVAAKRREGRDGRLDIRRTVRRSLITGGVPFEPTFRPRRPHKPELFLLCDVSGSVASFSRFTLHLVHALQEQFSTVRSFAFVDALDEVTSWLAGGEVDEAMRRMLVEAELVWLDGHSDYGRAFEGFHAEYAAGVGPRTTVLILGDARNNHRQSAAWVLADLQRRARHVYWLNPEPLHFWDSGDSIASNYARYVDDMVEVRNLNQLASFVERIA
ncbi:MAG: VWA domain-containing protein [Nitriliruptoraceae bacterium]